MNSPTLSFVEVAPESAGAGVTCGIEPPATLVLSSEAPVVRVYKCYEMVVEDNFGFRLCFSMDTSGSENSTGSMKERSVSGRQVC